MHRQVMPLQINSFHRDHGSTFLVFKVKHDFEFESRVITRVECMGQENVGVFALHRKRVDLGSFHWYQLYVCRFDTIEE